MKALLLIVFCMCSCKVLSQPYIRMDTTICTPYIPVMLGLRPPNPDYCYSWLGAEIPPEDRNNPNPTVLPDETTTYKCQVTDVDLSFTGFDEVTITVAMGTIAVLGEPIVPDLEDLEGQAYLQLKNTEITEILWTIEEDPDVTGCDIETESDYRGTISNCLEVGTIVVRATDANDPECYTEKDVIVGKGIIDLLARDLDDPERTANKSETLYVVGPSTIRFSALASQFLPPDQPEWGGSPLPEEEHALNWEAMLMEPGTYVVTCSDLVVTVIVLSDEVEEFEIPTDLSLWIQYQEAVSGLAPFLPDVCGSSPQITVNVNNQLIGTVKNKERNSDPGFYKHIKVIRDTDNGGNLVKSEGCGLLGNYSESYTIPGIGSFSLDAYITANDPPYTEIDNQILLETDEETEDLSTVALIFDQGIEISILPTISDNPVDIFVSGGGFSAITSTLNGELRLNGDKIDYRAKWGGLQMNPKGYLYTGTPSNPMWKAPINFSFNLMDGKQTGWKTFADLSSLTD